MRSFIAICRMWRCWRPSSTRRDQLSPSAESRGIGWVEFSLLRLALRGLQLAVLPLALIAVFLGTIPVAADGQVFSSVPSRERGLQVDSAVFSPQSAVWLPSAGLPAAAWSGSEPPRLAGQTYIVQPGDTLSQIAVRFQVDSTDLATANGLKDPDHIEVGQSLKLDLPAPLPQTLPLDGDLFRVQLWPWPPVQGQTLAVWLEARRPVTFGLSLDGATYPVSSQGRRGWALVPIPSLAPPGDKALIVTAGNSGVAIPVPLEGGVFDMYRIPAAVSRPILDQAQKVRAEAARLSALVSGRSATGWMPRSRFGSPLEGDFPRSSPYGSRRTYEPNPAVSAHEGEDYGAPAGTPVTAPAAGVVVLAEPLFVRGNAVVLDHGSGVFTGYWHLQELAVHPGDRVEPGQLLGRVGSTGLSTGAHLHWELRVNGVAVDPLQWVEE
jgi:murein DD-endopeptidase MepM/ murein hydrolase activator NlpD